MTADTSGNDEYLAAALEWLRLRLAAYTTAIRVEILVPDQPVTASARRWRRPAVETQVALPAATSETDAEAVAAAAMAEAAGRTPPPALVRLGRLLRLSPFEQHTLLLCAAMELDPTIAGRCADAQGDSRLAYPTFALALSALPDPAWDVVSAHRPLRRQRLVEIHQPSGGPLVTSRLQADERVVNYLKGLNELDDRLEPLLEAAVADPVELPDSQLAVVAAITSWYEEGSSQLVQLLGPDDHSKRLVAAEVAKRLGRTLYRLPARSVPSQAADLETLARLWSRERVLLDAALYLTAGENVPRLVARTEGLVFLAVEEPWRDLGVRDLRVDVARPGRAEQREAWLSRLGPDDEPAAEALAGQFDLNVDVIRDASERVGPGPDRLDRLWDHCMADSRPRMDALAQRLEPKATWDDLVLPEPERALIRQIANQLGRRGTVYETWGFADRMSRGLGISALFAGPSGTGKTMAAEVIARELRLNLYRIDLSAVVSKYIGETEKNLRRLFDAAEEGAALLFFDEADALFGKRSEVRDSHDRYANIETSYLLQRMESYRGLAILATNQRGALDQAFLRRLRFIVSFSAPGVVERRAIWARVFPPRTPLGPLDLDRLAAFQVTGAEIHNIAVQAAFAAAHDSTGVTMPLVLAAARDEFRKLEIPHRDSDFQ
jgi:hypothetical protein